MKLNQWTLALAAAGVVSLGSVVMAEEAQHQVMTALSSTTLSGYVDTSAIWQIGKFGTDTGRSYDRANRQDGFNLNAVKLSLEKPLDESQWAAGYKVDLVFGPDANIINTISSDAFIASDFAIQQAYVNLRAPVGNGLDFKVGSFSSIIGYESFDAYKNPNFSRSYGYAIEPFNHTGILASYQIVDWASVFTGIANSHGPSINSRGARADGTPIAESEKTYMGGFTLTAPESLGFLKGAQLYAGVVDGLTPTGASQSDVTSWYVGTTIPLPLEGLSVGASYDYRGTKKIGNIASSYANATALYLKYKATEKLSFANRVEYATGTAGTWTAGGINYDASTKPNPPTKGESFFADTFTVDYSLWANVITRAEFRWDHDMTARRGGAAAFGGGPLDGDKNALSLALNVIYQF